MALMVAKPKMWQMPVCAFPLAIYRTALSIQGKDGQEPGQDLLPFSNDVAVCTKHGGVRKSIVLGLFPFQILRGFALHNLIPIYISKRMKNCMWVCIYTYIHKLLGEIFFFLAQQVHQQLFFQSLKYFKHHQTPLHSYNTNWQALIVPDTNEH